MLKNFFIITFRNIVTHRIYSLINILGLSVGMLCTLLIALYVMNEVSYDKFYTDYARIYRITVEGKIKGKALNIAMTPPPMAGKLKSDINDIEIATRVARFGAWLVSYENYKFNEDSLLFADNNFFHLFDFKLIDGNPDSVLFYPRSIVLTKTAAKRYFKDTNPVGKKLRLETDSNYYTVTGLMNDVPGNSHLQFDMLVSLVTYEKHLQNLWVNHSVYTYIKLKKYSHSDNLQRNLPALVSHYVAPQFAEYFGEPLSDNPDGENLVKYNLQPISSIHLYSHLDNELETNGQVLYIYSFAIIAFLILIVACMNFVNLSTANSANRAREVAMRKVLGAERKWLVYQFLSESVIFSFIALFIAFLLAEIIIPHVNQYLYISLNFVLIQNLSSIILILSFTVTLGLLAGSYPALVISKYNPALVFYGKLNIELKKRWIRSIFVVFQFATAMLIIIMSIVVYAQIDFMLNKELGFDKERILVIRRPDALKANLTDFKNEILQHQNIEAVTNSNSIPGRNFITSTSIFEADTFHESLLMNQIFVNYDFDDAFKLKMVEGRFFSEKVAGDSFSCVINETAAKAIGFPKILGNYISLAGFPKKYNRKLRIIGIVKDFHFESLDKAIEPLVFSPMTGNWEGYLNVRLSAQGIDKSINFIEETWKKYTNEYPFVSFFLDQDFERNYHSVIRTGRLLLVFGAIAMVVACLGLFGMVLFTINQRTKEIAIRKALGASFYHILAMLTREVFQRIFIAAALAGVLAYFFSELWLKGFNSHIQFTLLYFFYATVIVFLISFLVLVLCIVVANRDSSEVIKNQ